MSDGRLEGDGAQCVHLGGSRRTLRALWVGLTVLLCAIGAAAPARADNAAARQAKALATEAYELFDRGRHLEAAAKLGEAYELQGYWEHLWNQARALEEGGALVAAYDAYERLVADHDLSVARRKEALAKLAGLAPRLVGGLALTCDVQGATFEAEGPTGTIKGTLPWRQDRLRSGEYEVVVRHPGHVPEQLTVEVGPGEDVSRHVTLRARGGRLVVRSSAAGGSVAVDGEEVGHTPEVALQLPVGTHEVTVRFHGRRAWRSTVVVPPGRTVELQAEPPAASSGGPSGQRPEQATLKVDGVQVSVGPGEVLELLPGEHVVQVTAPGHRVFDELVQVREGTTTPVLVRLKPDLTAGAGDAEERPLAAGPARLRTLGWSGLALAATLAAGGAGLWWSSARLEQEATDLDSEARATGDEHKLREAQDLDQRWVRRRNIAVGCLVGAGVAAALGAGALVLAPPDTPTSSSVTVVPLGTGVAASWSFP